MTSKIRPPPGCLRNPSAPWLPWKHRWGAPGTQAVLKRLEGHRPKQQGPGRTPDWERVLRKLRSETPRPRGSERVAHHWWQRSETQKQSRNLETEEGLDAGAGSGEVREQCGWGFLLLPCPPILTSCH